MDKDNMKKEFEKTLRGFLTLGINGEYFTHTDPAIIVDRLVKNLTLPVVSNNEVAVCECRPNTNIYCETVTKCSKCNGEVKTIRTN